MAQFGEELLSVPGYLREELYRTLLAYCDLEEDGCMEKMCRSYLDPEYVYLLEGVDSEAGYWQLQSTTAELQQLFKEDAAFKLVGRIRHPHRSHESEYAGVIELAFRGSDRVAHMLINAVTFLVATEIGGCIGKVHQGFQMAYLTLRADMLQKIEAGLTNQGISKQASLLVRATGHSLGGALATLCSYDLAHQHHWENVSIQCMTWGCPRVGNRDFANACYQAVPRYGRYINKMDIPSCWPGNPKDPHDYYNRVRSVVGAASSPFCALMKATDYHHACPCVVLDPNTSTSLHVMIAGMEVAAFARDGNSAAATALLKPHSVKGYVEALAHALEATKLRLDSEWAKLPSVGTWLMPYPVEEESPKQDTIPSQFLKTVNAETQDFLKYGLSLLSSFKGRGPRVLLDWHDDIGRYSKQQLAAMGVEPNRFEKVPLETILKSSSELLHTEEGRLLLRHAQEQLLTMLPMLTVAAHEESRQSKQSSKVLAQMEKHGVAAKVLSWSRQKLMDAEKDPEMLRNLLASFKMESLTELGTEVYLTNAARLRSITDKVDFSDTVASSAKGLGLVFEDGVLKLDGLIAKGHQYIESDKGTELLRKAQEKALDFTKAGLFEQANGYIQQLEQSENSKNSRQLLEQGRALLASAEDDPDALKKWLASIEASEANQWQEWGAKMVSNNDGKRDEFIKTVSDQCSAFLTEQLRIIKVPKSAYEYCIDNIDLSSCSVSKDGFFIDLKSPRAEDAADMEGSPVTSEEGKRPVSSGEILRVTAKDIKVRIPELKWQYKQKNFPYFNGNGTAETIAHGAEIMLAFQLRSAKLNGDLVPRLALACSHVVIDKLVLNFKESKLSWLYNTMGYLFQTAVRDYVVSTLGAAVNGNMASLLTPLNGYLRPYWPLLLSNVAIPLEKLPSTDLEEYTVLLGSEGKVPVGADFVDAEGGLTLVALEDGGALHRWNQSAPEERKVKTGDLLYQVDGKCGEDMIQALDKQEVDELLFRRAATKGAVIDWDEAMFDSGPDGE
ncbi:unnamed protein product [Durusdinium trenchii]|uniref:Fungal lipase-type domain-containing protein n=2 Tax=Durusdinium trenchii TaxID=1381693 RepID=A0ABP0IKA0_9DINO